MFRILAFSIVPLLVLAGCVQPAATEAPPVEANVGPSDAMAEPVVQEMQGRHVASAAGTLAHQDSDLEMRVAPLQREGFLLDVIDVPQVLQVEIEWKAPVPGSMMFAMVNVPNGAAGEVIDYVSERSDAGKVCMRIPVADLKPDVLSVMAHSSGAVNLEYVLRVTTLGGEATLIDGPHMEVERENGEKRDSLPCEEHDDAHAA